MPIPIELQGKSPEEIAAYYENQLSSQRTEFETRLADANQPPPPNKPAPQPNAADFWANPQGATQGMIKEQFDALAGVMQDALIASCRMSVKDKFPDFAKFQTQIDATMKLQPKFNQIQPAMWETVYIHVKGINADRLIAEARQEGIRMSGEGTQAPDPPDPNAPVKLNGVEGEVAAAFGMDATKWANAKARVEGGVPWPAKTIA